MSVMRRSPRQAVENSQETSMEVKVMQFHKYHFDNRYPMNTY